MVIKHQVHFINSGFVPWRDREFDKLDEDDNDEDKDNFDPKLVVEEDWDIFPYLNFFLHAKVWSNTKKIAVKVNRVFLNMSKKNVLKSELLY